MPFSRTVQCNLMVLFCGAALWAVPVLAQSDAPPPPPPNSQGPPPGYGGPRRGGPEHRLEMLKHELDLTADQTEQAKALFETERAKMDALRSNSSLSQDDRRSQMMAIHQDEDAKLRAMLTPDQVTKYDAMQARMHDRMREHREDGGPPPPPPSPPGNPQ